MSGYVRAVVRDGEIIAACLQAWAAGESAPSEARRLEQRQDCRVQYDDRARTVFSYGRHFPIATVVKRRRGSVIVLNGDEWRGNGWHPSRTGDHQSSARRAAEGIAAANGARWQSIIVPFTALTGAAIVHGSIRPLEIRDDSRDSFRHVVTLPADTFGAIVAPTFDPDCEKRVFRAVKRTITANVQSSGDDAAMSRAGIAANESRTLTIERTTVFRDYDYSVHPNGWQTHNPPRVSYSFANQWDSLDATLADDGATLQFKWSTERHWLGDSLFTADRVIRCQRCNGMGTVNPGGVAQTREHCQRCRGNGSRRMRRRWLSSFDYNERRPLYFLAALPTSSKAATVAMAFDDLAPRAVHAAYARGIDVQRQGDVFFVATPLTDADIAERAERRARLTMHTRDAAPRKGEVGYRAPLTASERRAMAAWRRDEWRRIVRESVRRATSHEHESAQPLTLKGARERFAKIRADYARDVEIAEVMMRRRIFGTIADYRYGRRTATVADRRATLAYDAREARKRIDRLAATVRADSNGYTSMRHARDAYRKCYGANARAAWDLARHRALERFAPNTLHDSDHWRRTRELARQTLAIYGTAHSATDVAVTAGGITYVRGTVRHVPSVIGDRRDADHAPLTLPDGFWYLAVRNTVPSLT